MILFCSGRLERSGTLMRLDQNILPTRNRLATVSASEMTKLKGVKNIIRKGRIGRIDVDKVIFLSGEEMKIPSGTSVIDCSRNCLKFQRPDQLRKVFDGDEINIQFILLPPPG